MTKWWIAFAIAVPVSYLLGVEMAKSDEVPLKTKVWMLQIRDLKDVSCEILYKAMKDDLENKYQLHKAGIYTMPDKVYKEYQDKANEWARICLPPDPDVDRIERNSMPTDIIYTNEVVMP